MPKKSRGEAEVGNVPSRQVQRVGNPNKVRVHETPYGEPGKVGVTKWKGPAGGRDAGPPAEKEPGKSRGPGVGIPADPRGIEKNRR